MWRRSSKLVTNKIIIVFAIISILVISGCAISRNTALMKKIEPFAQLADGKYIGNNSNVICKVKLEVTLKGGRIDDIRVINKFYTYPIAAIAYNKIPQRIIYEQSLDVDAITAATISTNNIKAAVLDALNKARK